MSIKDKIISGFLFISFLALISSGIFAYYLSKVGNASTKLLEENYRAVKASEELIISLVKIDRILSKVCSGQNYDESVLLRILESERKVARANLGILRNNVVDPGEKTIFGKLEGVFHKYEANIDDFHTSTDRLGLYFTLLQWQYEIILQGCISMVDANHSILNLKDKAAHTLYFRSKINTFLVTTIVLLFIGVAIQKIPKEIIKPIVDFTDTVKRISKGEYYQEIEVNSRNELAELARSFKIVGNRLKETEEKFWLVTESLYDIVVFSHLNAKIFYTTPSIERILGYRPEEVKNKKIFSLLHPRDVKKVKNLLASCHQIRKSDVIELRIKKKDGQYLWMEVSYTFQYDKQGKPIYLQSTAWDITKRKQAEQEIKFALHKEKDLNGQITKANSEIDQFMYSTSHNLRGPLASVLGAIYVIKASDSTKEQHEMIGLIEKSLHRLDNTIYEIIEYGKNRKLEVKTAFINFESLIEEVLEDLAFMEGFKQMNIHYEVEEKINFCSDLRRLKIIFENLISNAIKYRNPNNSNPELNISVKSSGQYALIRFEDNGNGVPPDHKKKIFEMFYRATDQASGAGLGLYIVQENLQKLKGSVKLNSKYGKGATFTIKVKNLA